MFSATVSVGYRRAEVPHALDGFGIVVPRTERRSVFACTFSSVKYPGRAPEGHVLLRCFVGGALNEAKGAVDNVAHATQETIGGVMETAKGAGSSVLWPQSYRTRNQALR